MKNKLISIALLIIMLTALSVPVFADVVIYAPIISENFSESSDGSYKILDGSVSYSEKEKALALAPSASISYSPEAGQSGWSGSYKTTLKMKLKNWEETAAGNMFILTTKSKASDEKYIFNYKSNGFRIDKMYKPMQYVMLTPSFSGAVKYIADGWNTVEIENLFNDDNTMTINLYFNSELVYSVNDSSNISENGGITIESHLNSEMLIKSIEVTEIITKRTVREPDEPAFDTIGDKFENECLLVRQLGIMQDDENNMFNAGNFMTRKDFAQTIANYAGLGGVSPVAGEPSIYSDITVTDPYYNAVYAVTSMGYMKGTGNNSFSPDETVSLEQALKVLVSLLGYSHLGEVNGGYPNGFIAAANQLGLLEDLSIKDAFTRGVCAQLITNSLEVPVCERYEYIDGSFTVKESGNTMLSLRDVICGKGVVSDNGITGLVTDKNSQDGRVVIGNQRMQTGETSAYKYIGYNVKYYAVEGENELPKLIYVKPYNNNVIILDGEDILSNTTKTTLIYSDKNDNERKLNISPIADMIYNGKAYPRFDALMMVPDGDITLVDNNNDNVYDVLVVNDYKNLVVEYSSDYSKTVTGLYKNSVSKIISLKDEAGKIIEIYKDGAPCDFGKIKQNDVLDILESKCGLYVKVVISSEKASGTLEEYDSYENTYKIGGVDYKISKYFEEALKNYDAVKPVIGGSYVFLLNSRGQIAGVNSSNARNIGYMRDINMGNNLSDEVKVNIFTESGNWVAYTLAEKVELDGITVRSENISITLPNPVIYQINSEGKINNIVTVTPRGNKDDGLHLDYSGELMYKSSPESFQLEYFPDNAVVFAIPKLAEDKYDEMFYSVNPQFTNDITYKLDLYNVGENAAPEIIIWQVEKKDLNINPGGNLMVVEKIIEKLRDNTGVTTVCGFYNGIYQELFVDSSVVVPALAAGDLIQIKTDSNGNIISITESILTDAEKASSADKAYDRAQAKYVPNTDSNASNRVVYGEVKYIDSVNKRICLLVEGSDKWVPLSPNGIRYYEVKETAGGKKVVNVSEFDGIEYKSKVLVRMRYSYPYEAVIYHSIMR